MPQHYPFTAVVGHDDVRDSSGAMALALILTTISPEVGGVLVRGEKGTAKSTMVRALADVLPPIEVIHGDRFSANPADADDVALSPDGPFEAGTTTLKRPVRLVELPVGATEDRVLGSIHLERALADGRAEYEPGLLARAHRGVLYVDEVNLLHDHLVDLLLDAAAMGRATVERDSVSVVHAARFVLVGTMNPEEGELRPQLLDRFGLTVEVAAPRDPARRVEVVRRRIAHDSDPGGFAREFAEREDELTARIQAAAARVGSVELSDAALTKIAEVCAGFEVDGLRADIVTARAAVAHAAWNGRTRVTRADIRAAALLALPHRRRRNPFDAPGLDEELLDRLLGDDLPDDDPDGPDGPDGDPEPDGSKDPETDGPDDSTPHDPDQPEDGSDSDRPPGTEDSSGPDRQEDRAPEQPNPQSSDQPEGQQDAEPPGSSEDAADQLTVVTAGTTYRPRVLRLRGVGSGESGRRSRAITETGRRIGARLPTGDGTGSLHLLETFRAAVPHQRMRGRTSGRVLFRGSDLRLAVREGHESNLVLFCVDASGSMAARARMEPVKSAILSLLLDAYQRRDKVGLVTFRGAEGQVLLPPTSSIDVAARRLEDLPAGGRTPLAEGLLAARHVLAGERIRDPRRRPLLVVVTDGRATSGPDAVRRSHQAASLLAADGVQTIVVDSETGRFRMGLARDLGRHLQAELLPLEEITADALTGAIRSETSGHKNHVERPEMHTRAATKIGSSGQKYSSPRNRADSRENLRRLGGKNAPTRVKTFADSGENL